MTIISAYYKNEEMTKEFLDNIQKQTPNEKVILVNAGSKPIEHPIIERIDLPENKSFANSFNEGLRATDDDYVCIMNNDVFPQSPLWLDHIVRLAKNTKSWITAPLNNKTLINNYPVIGIHDGCIEVGFFPAVCWVISRECLDKVGLFDERFEPAMWEDNDYCHRVRLAGGKIVLDTEITLIHKESQTTNLFNFQKIHDTNMKRYMDKWHK